MSVIRLRRLNSDAERLRDYVRRHPRVRLIQESGDPPESFHLEYKVKSVRKQDDDVVEVDTHLVEINLPRNYPRTAPQCRMLSPVFHPNIAPHAICVGDHWSAGESLQSIVIRIGEMLAFQSYNVRSPLNGEAARWVEENADRLPLDRVTMLAEEENESQQDARDRPPKRQPRPSSSEFELQSKDTPTTKPAAHVITCTHCEKRYKVALAKTSGTARCKACGEAFEFQVTPQQ